MNQAELQKKTEQVMRELATGIDSVLKQLTPDMGFALIVFKFNEPGISNYISNGDRPSMIEALKETVARLEARQDIPAASGSVH